MKYLSVCSGIEAATCAWHQLGWTPFAFSEIEPFPSAVLAHHYPTVPNLGDMTKFKEWPDAAIDLLVGGTPCQSFSVAGLRKGLDDPRGNLMLTYGAIAAKYRPEWLVWENVPGVLSSNGGRDFGTFLGMLGKLGYGFAYRVLDAQYFGVAQRRRRVFVVGNLGSWRRAAAVLFERHSLQGNPAPRREAGKIIAPCLDVRAGRSGETTFHTSGGLVPELARCDTTGEAKRQDYETCTLITHPISYGIRTANTSSNGCGIQEEATHTLDRGMGIAVAHALRGEGFDASEDGTGRGTPLVPVAYALQHAQIGRKDSAGPQGKGWQEEVAFTQDSRSCADAVAIAFSCKDNGRDATNDLAPTLRSMAASGSHANGGGQMAVAFAQNQRDEVRLMDVAGALAAEPGAKQQTYAHVGMQVRRLTPLECERLQGFADDYTLIPVRGKPAADGPRYKALGNSMAVPCMAWIGKRIAEVEAITAARVAA